MAPTIKKQLSFMLQLPDWVLVRDAAIRRKLTMQQLLVEWVEPQLRKLRREKPRITQMARMP